MNDEQATNTVKEVVFHQLIVVVKNTHSSQWSETLLRWKNTLLKGHLKNKCYFILTLTCGDRIISV